MFWGTVGIIGITLLTYHVDDITSKVVPHMGGVAIILARAMSRLVKVVKEFMVCGELIVGFKSRDKSLILFTTLDSK